jgi:hypothetical protein
VPNDRFLRPLLTAFALLLLLAGCQTTGESAAQSADKAASTAGAKTAATNAGEAAKPKRAGAKTHVVRYSPDEFVGYSPERVLPILGAPDFVRRDGTAQIWQYRATNCVLDLFIYKNDDGTHVKHAEIRPRVPGAESVEACYSRMRQERQGKPSG